jgi:hypothetical protein
MVCTGGSKREKSWKKFAFPGKTKGERMMKSVPLAPGVISELLIAELAPNSALALPAAKGAGASEECLFPPVIINDFAMKGGGINMG